MRNADAVVIGSGPNGLAAAIVLARAGVPVTVLEAEETIGGGARSAELTLPGFVHDVCSAVHPMAAASPFFRTLPLKEHGLEWVEPPAAVAHPFDEGPAALAERSLEKTAAGLGSDGPAYRQLMGVVAAEWPQLEQIALGRMTWPRHPFWLAHFGLRALRSAAGVARSVFDGRRARGLLAGIAAHGMLPLEEPLTAGIGMTLGSMAHVAGWPFPRGGTQRLTDALVGYLRSLGAEVVTGTRVESVDELAGARVILCDLSPKPLVRIAGRRFPEAYRKRLLRYRYGAAAYKVDWALGGPIPWKAEEVRRAGTVHLGGTLRQIAASEREVYTGRHPEQPYVLLSQPTLFDATRAPEGRHTAWGYCHVPNGSEFEMLERIEGQIERFAPGFRERVLDRRVTRPAEIERHNANMVGGDIAAGATDWRQFFTRPTAQLYLTPVKGLYICSAATPPGVGVHGMCGYYAARVALRRLNR